MSFSVTILGCASAKPTANRHPSAQAVNIHEQYYLVDAGEGAQQQLVEKGRAVVLVAFPDNHVGQLFKLFGEGEQHGVGVHFRPVSAADE